MPYIRPNDDATKHVTFMWGLDAAVALVSDTLKHGQNGDHARQLGAPPETFDYFARKIIEENF